MDVVEKKSEEGDSEKRVLSIGFGSEREITRVEEVIMDLGRKRREDT